jgi:PhnB protein
MTSSYKPDGYTSVSPYLIVDGASATIDFLTRVFNAQEIRRFADADGRIMHSEVRIDDSVVMIADQVAEWPAVPANVHVYVADVDATYKKAIEAGATSIQEPVKKDDADKRSGVKDARGTSWWIATKID